MKRSREDKDSSAENKLETSSESKRLRDAKSTPVESPAIDGENNANLFLDCVVIWFRRDLRCYDNTALSRAHAYASQIGVPLVGVFVVSLNEWLVDHDMAPAQARLYLKSVHDLKNSLEDIKIPLVVLNSESRIILTNNPAIKLLNESHESSHDQCVTDTSKIHTKEERRYAMLFTPFKKTWIVTLIKNPSLASAVSTQLQTAVKAVSLREVPNVLPQQLRTVPSACDLYKKRATINFGGEAAQWLQLGLAQRSPRFDP
ncbi:hypothetical protein HK100_012014 [Physocladia obscura]|uniref:Photolyase/cryptochrome alpha/beta domain-containing protein n=1 Tax=Physocladia obscura TaxID=109957 RepID=A0AAD5T3B5_9FUNG|nr:hypothetical protein HK100_012014 [Physocladia obscura]